jgi:transcriptional regulator with XRE-family HTH domain
MPHRATLLAFPTAVLNSIIALGDNLRIARRRRRLSVATMAERVGISVHMYRRIERGDPDVPVGLVDSVYFALGMGAKLGHVAEPSEDGHRPRR